MIHAIDHIAIVVADLDRSVKFYTEVLGFRKTHEGHTRVEGGWVEAIIRLPGVKQVMVVVEPPGGGMLIELVEFRAPVGVTLPENARANTRGLRHLAMRVDDITAMAARLRAAGVRIFNDPVRVPDGVVESPTTVLYFLDPDDVILELAEVSET